jgi:hypothetical protein
MEKTKPKKIKPLTLFFPKIGALPMAVKLAAIKRLAYNCIAATIICTTFLENIIYTAKFILKSNG